MNEYCHDIIETLCNTCGESLDWDYNYCTSCDDDGFDCNSYCIVCGNYIYESYHDASDMYCDKFINAANTIQIKYKYYKLKKIKDILSKVVLKDCVNNIMTYYTTKEIKID